MSSNIEFTNLVENEVFEDEPAFPPAPPVQRPTAFTSSMQQAPTAAGAVPNMETPLRDNRLKLAHRTEGLRTIILAFGVFSFGLTVALVIELFIGAPAIAPHGGVSCSSELCSNMGVEQLKKGGNAIDAAITVMLCIGLVRPQSAGLGGGGLMIIHDHKTHNTTLLDFREIAPAALKISNQEALRTGGLSIGVPGELAGMIYVHEKFGQLPWNKLFTPVIKLAEEGWSLDKKDETDIRRRDNDLGPADPKYDPFRKIFNVAASQGRIRRTDLANLLRDLSASSQEAQRLFYRGAIANEIIDTVTKAGGVMAVEDLKSYSVVEREPMIAMFRNFKVITFPAPSSGSLLVYMLNQLEDLKSKDVGTVDYYAKLAEVTFKAFKCRSRLGDPDDVAVSIHEQHLTNKSLDLDHYCDSSKVKPPPEDRGTSHVNVIDNDELMVSVTSSLNHWFGSLLVTPSGILLNNEMDDFDVTPDFNQETPRNRPLSSMVPTIVLHSKRDCLQRMAIGGTNGTRIPASVVQTLVNLLVKEDDLATAVEAPKLFCSITGCQLENFSLAEQVAAVIKEREKLQVTIVNEKISTVGVLLKLNSTVDGYIETSSYGKSITY